MKLVPNWRKLHKAWSVRLGVVATALTSALIAFPELAMQVWQWLPGEFKTFLPEQYMPLVGVVLFVLSLLAKFIEQQSLKDTPK